jgi:hypothetical protein
VWLLLCATACSLDRSGLEGDGGRRDGGADGAIAPRDADMPASDGGRDASSDSGTDAGIPVPTAIVALGTSGPNGAHPAVVWDGDEFVVGVVVRDVLDHLELVRIAPGAGVEASRTRVVSDRRAIEDVSLAVLSTGELGVAWSEDGGAGWSIGTSRLGGAPEPGPRHLREADRDDVHIHPGAGPSGFAVVYRDGFPGGEALTEYTTGSRTVANAFALGETALRKGGTGSLLALGGTSEVFEHDGVRWSRAISVSGLGLGSEGDVVDLGTGRWISIWLHTPGAERVLSSVPIAAAGAPMQLPEVPLGAIGSDPALAATAERALLAFAYAIDASTRTLGLLMLDDQGAAMGSPCSVPPLFTTANDPDVACAGSYCAVVWMEADSYDAATFAIRFVQVPVVPDLVCP